MSDALLRRKEVAAFLTSMGLRTAAASLAKFAVIGGGPAYRKWGRWPVYSKQELVRWAEERLGQPATSTLKHFHERRMTNREREYAALDDLPGESDDQVIAAVLSEMG